MEKFFNRTKQLWDDYQPDMIYFDDSVLPMHGVIGSNRFESRRTFLQFQHPVAWSQRSRDEWQGPQRHAAQGDGL